jgi:integrase
MYRYYFNKKEKSAGIGSYPKITLNIARTVAADYKALVADGKNPVLEKKVRSQQRSVEDNQTFGSVAREWIKHNKPDWSANHTERNEGIIRRYLLPDLGRLPIQSIEESYLFSVLKPVYDKGLKESARRTRAIAAQIFTYGKDTHRCTNNPAKDMAGNSYFKKPVPKHFAAIDQSDVPKLMADLRKTGAEQRLKPQTVCALLMVIYTGHRDHAVRGAKWKEFDLVNHVWEVPAERMKNRNSHKVSLPSQAIQALSAIRSITFKDPDSFVFSSNSKTGYISENTLRLALHRLGYKVTVHGFRTLITTVLNERGFNADAVERQLDHIEKNAVRRAYLRSEFDEVRTSTMQWFADWCDGTMDGVTDNNVISLQRRV